MLISYAQNMEDVILWRALRHVTSGFYIDIGAQDPVVDSVSLLFHNLHWQGIHVEPVAKFAQELHRARPGDDVLQVAIGKGGPCMTFFEIPDTGLSTGRPSIAEAHRAAGYSAHPFEVPCMPLAQLLERSRGREVHWLKIDAEGMEANVIESWQPAAVRPWIVVVEAIAPSGGEQTFSRWEPALRALGYEFVYFDGVNRFYVSDAHSELKASFGPGPNIMDGFMLSGQATSPFCNWLRQELVTAQEARDTARQDLAIVQEALTAERGELAATRKELMTTLQTLAEKEAEAEEAHAALAEMRVLAKQAASARDSLAIELKTAEAKVTELNDLSHRLWVTAANYSRELEERKSMTVVRIARRLAGRVSDRTLKEVRKRPRLKRALASALDLAPAIKPTVLAFSAARSPDRLSHRVKGLTQARSHLRQAARRILEKLLAEVRRRPASKARLLRVLDVAPRLKQRLIVFGARRPQGQALPVASVSWHRPTEPSPSKPDLPAPCDTVAASEDGRRVYGQMRALRAAFRAGHAEPGRP